MVRILSNCQNDRSKHYEDVNNEGGEDVFMLESDHHQQSEGTTYLMSVSVDNRPGHSVSIPQHGNVSDTSDESTCSSFEMLLPDFSSLGIGGNQLKCDNKDASTCITPSPDVKHNDYRKSLSSLTDVEDIVSLLLQENRRLKACLEDSNQFIREANLQAKNEVGAKEETVNGVVEVKTEQKETKKDKKSNKKSNNNKKGGDDNVSILNLSEQLNVAEEAQAQLSQDLQRVTQEKLEIQNQLASINLELESMKGNNEQLNHEKWELSQVNTDLQQRLQQTVALARMQAEGNQNRLQEEVSRMLFQLEEERKVTANLSKSLELEKRKVESLEQRAKHNGSSRGSREADNHRRRSSILPETVQDAETRLSQSMETYRQRCDNLGNSLHGLMDKIEDERFFGDLATEVNKLRKLLSDEKKKIGSERNKLGEVHALFEQIYDDYSNTINNVEVAGKELQQKVQQQVQQQKQQAVLNNIAKTNIQDNVDSMTVRLMQLEEELGQERREHQRTRDKLSAAALDLEALPLLQAQVEVYQSDFNAERQARERIAGEKADLEEQMRKAGVSVHKPQPSAPQQTIQRAPVHHGGGGDHFNGGLGGGGQGGHGGHHNGINNEHNRTMFLNNGAVRDRVNNMHNRDRDQQFDFIPATVNTRPDPGAGADAEEKQTFDCPKCNREFRNTTLLTRHVNDCLDRDF